VLSFGAIFGSVFLNVTVIYVGFLKRRFFEAQSNCYEWLSVLIIFGVIMCGQKWEMFLLRDVNQGDCF
jgi:hypothetical protein